MWHDLKFQQTNFYSIWSDKLQWLATTNSPYQINDKVSFYLLPKKEKVGKEMDEKSYSSA